METERIQRYYLSCNCRSIKLAFKRIDKNGKDNDLYYSTYLNKKEADFNNALDSAEYDDKTWQRLISFNSRLTTIQKKIINLYRIVCEQNDKTGNEKRDLETVISIKENSLKKLFTPLEYNALFVKSLVEKDDFQTALKVHLYLGKRLESVILDFKQVYQIDLKQSPLKNDLKQLAKSYKKAIDIEQIKILKDGIKKGKTENIPVDLKEFFPSLSDEKVLKIQNEFKALDIGKHMAILIYLLDKKYSLVFIDDSDRKKRSRLHFVRAFTKKKLKDIKAVGNYLEGSTGELKKIHKKTDPAYIEISERLKQIVSNG